MAGRMIYCGYCGKEHEEDSGILLSHQRLLGNSPRTYGKKEVGNMKTKKVNNCQLEVDKLRGVLYVHGPNGTTLVRICQIPLAVVDNESIDVVYDRELARGRTTRQVRLDQEEAKKEMRLSLAVLAVKVDGMLIRRAQLLKAAGIVGKGRKSPV